LLGALRPARERLERSGLFVYMAITAAPIDMRIHGHCCCHRYAHTWPIDMRIHGHYCCHRYAHSWPIDTRIHGHYCCHRYAHTWPIDTRIYGHSCPHRCAHTPIYGLYICVYMMFHDRPYRRQRPPGTTLNASNF